MNALEDGNLFFTIPNDDGWVVKVDGKKVKTKTALDLFMTVPLSTGTHNIELEYTPKGLLAGIFITTIALLICLIFVGRKFWQSVMRLYVSSQL